MFRNSIRKVSPSGHCQCMFLALPVHDILWSWGYKSSTDVGGLGPLFGLGSGDVGRSSRWVLEHGGWLRVEAVEVLLGCSAWWRLNPIGQWAGLPGHTACVLGESWSGVSCGTWSFHGGAGQLEGISKDLDQLVLWDGMAVCVGYQRHSLWESELGWESPEHPVEVSLHGMVWAYALEVPGWLANARVSSSDTSSGWVGFLDWQGQECRLFGSCGLVPYM